MNEQSSFERIVADSVTSVGMPAPSDGAIERTLSRVSGKRQRPRWLALIKEPPMRISSSLAVGSPTARVVAIMVTTLLLALTVLGAGIAGSRLLAADGTIVVDQSGNGTVTTITEAVAMAQDGDTILVRPGVYVEAVVVDKDVTVRGDGERSEIIIEALPNPPTSPLERGNERDQDPYALLIQESNAVVAGLTFRDRNALVHAIGGEPRLEDLAFESVGWPCCRPIMGSLVLTGGTKATVSDNSFVGGGGIRMYDGSEALIEANRLSDGPGIFGDFGEGTIIRANTISGRDGNAIYMTGPTTALIEANTFEDIVDSAIAVPGGEGLDSGVGIDPVIEGNTISKAGQGIYVGAGAVPLIVDNVLVDNGYGIEIIGSSPIIEGNTITGGSVGLFVEGEQAVPSLSGNTICDNGTNLELREGATMPDIEGNEICPDAPAAASE